VESTLQKHHEYPMSEVSSTEVDPGDWKNLMKEAFVMEQAFHAKEKKVVAVAAASSLARELSLENATHSTWPVKVAAASSVAASVDLVVVVAAAFAMEVAAVAACEQDLVVDVAASFLLAAI